MCCSRNFKVYMQLKGVYLMGQGKGWACAATGAMRGVDQGHDIVQDYDISRDYDICYA